MDKNWNFMTHAHVLLLALKFDTLIAPMSPEDTAILSICISWNVSYIIHAFIALYTLCYLSQMSFLPLPASQRPVLRYLSLDRLLWALRKSHSLPSPHLSLSIPRLVPTPTIKFSRFICLCTYLICSLDIIHALGICEHTVPAFHVKRLILEA